MTEPEVALAATLAAAWVAVTWIAYRYLTWRAVKLPQPPPKRGPTGMTERTLHDLRTRAHQRSLLHRAAIREYGCQHAMTLQDDIAGSNAKIRDLHRRWLELIEPGEVHALFLIGGRPL